MTQRTRTHSHVSSRNSSPAPAIPDDPAHESTDPAMDVATARAAYQRSRSTLAEYSLSELTHVNFTPRDAASVAFRVALRCATPALRTRFEALAKASEFRLSALDHLRDASLATWYVATKITEMEVTVTRAIAPTAVAELNEITPRMQTVLQLLFADDPSIGPLLLTHGKARSHRAQAEAALYYVELYTEHAAVVRTVPKRYKTTDATRARSAANTLLASLDRIEPTELAAMRIEQRRAVTWLTREYTEVASAGTYLERTNPTTAAEHFPSLVSAGRSVAKPRKKIESTDNVPK
jgi:hypothetical protein